jgi:transposase-like protein
MHRKRQTNPFLNRLSFRREDGGMETKRSAEEGQRLVEEFERSGLRRRQFCEKVGIPITSLDYWRGKAEKTRMVEVEIQTEAPPGQATSLPGFAVIVSNGRRIESGWSFREAELTRLIRIVEGA